MRMIAVSEFLELCRTTDEVGERLDLILERQGVRAVILMTGSTHSAGIARQIEAGLHAECHSFQVSAADFLEVQRAESLIFERRIGAVVAVGGGRVIDVAKYAAHRAHLPFIACPTQPSHDGIASAISVIEAQDGRKRSMGARMPEALIVSQEVMLAAPRSALQSGAGDLLSNLSALRDWELAVPGGEAYDHFAALLSRQAADLLLRTCEQTQDLASPEAAAVLLDGLILSGVAMTVSGTSRPCSGSEHLLSHALDYLEPRNPTLHGIKVGAATLFTRFLQTGALDPALVFAARHIGLPLAFGNCASFSSLNQIFATARAVRPDRHTVLDHFSDAELLEAYKGFEAELGRHGADLGGPRSAGVAG